MTARCTRSDGAGPHRWTDMDARRDQALELMAQFAERTGLSADRPPQRYLWTDAFAVCTFLGLGRATGASSHTELALRLVDRVHHVLGRHRADDRRAGWISGLDAERKVKPIPTCGGLRIGKPLPERRLDEPMDERLEWERDGQYFHYLTKWMHALDQVTRSTGQPLFNAGRASSRTPRTARSPTRRRHGAAQADVLEAQHRSVASAGRIDGAARSTRWPGYYAQLEATGAGAEPSLGDAIADFTAMVEPQRLATGDPLGIGGLLTDAYRLGTTGAADRPTLRPGRDAPRSGARGSAVLPEAAGPSNCPRHAAWPFASSAWRSDWPPSSGTNGARLRPAPARRSISCRDTYRCGARSRRSGCGRSIAPWIAGSSTRTSTT